eukprot:5938681-Pleurochrysis_carterae.AAC.1
MIFVTRGNRHQVKHSCQSDASDSAAGDILHIPPAISATAIQWLLWETAVRCTATAVALQVAAHQRGACFEASYQRKNELTKQHTKQTAADRLQAESEPRESSSLHTKHVVN